MPVTPPGSKCTVGRDPNSNACLMPVTPPGSKCTVGAGSQFPMPVTPSGSGIPWAAMVSQCLMPVTPSGSKCTLGRDPNSNACDPFGVGNTVRGDGVRLSNACDPFRVGETQADVRGTFGGWKTMPPTAATPNTIMPSGSCEPFRVGDGQAGGHAPLRGWNTMPPSAALRTKKRPAEQRAFFRSRSGAQRSAFAALSAAS